MIGKLTSGLYLGTRCMDTLKFCKICGSSRLTMFADGISDNGLKYSLILCESCETSFKLLEDEYEVSLDAAYSENQYIQNRLNSGRPKTPERVYLKNPIAVDAMGKEFLEIGPGSGGTCLYAKSHGWNVSTLDIVAAHNKYYKEHIGVSHVYQSFHDIKAGTFDLVVLTHVIEHVVDPKEFLENIFRVLKRNGKVIISTPNHKSFFARCFGARWWSYSVDDHFTFFNAKSLTQLADHIGFTVSSRRYRGPSVAHSISAYFMTSAPSLKPSQRDTKSLSVKGLLKAVVRDTLEFIFAPLGKTSLGYEMIFELGKK